MSFDPDAFGPELAPLLAGDRRRGLGGAKSQALDQERIVSAVESLGSSDFARCCVAGLWLLIDDLEASHSVSQELHTAEGSLWHGIMHRREGDFGNAKYWFRQAGSHLIYDEISQKLGAEFDPYRFVDDCLTALRTGRELERCLDWQQAEWETLFTWCWQHR
jgi:hypothetical protein